MVKDMKLRHELSRPGYDNHAIARAVRKETLHRLRRGAFTDPGRCSPEELHVERVRAVIAQSAVDQVASHISAGVIHRLPVDRRRLDKVHVIRPGVFRTTEFRDVIKRQRPGVSSVLIDGIPVTPLTTTAVDLARLLPFADGVAAVDAARRAGAELGDLRTMVASQPGRKGNGMARRAIEFSDPRAESGGESHARVQMAAAGLPAPALQVVFVDAEGEMRVDFAWPDHGVVVEFDGFVKYGRLLAPGQELADVLRLEKHREARLRALGLVVIRIVWEDILRPARLGALIRGGFRRAAA